MLKNIVRICLCLCLVNIVSLTSSFALDNTSQLIECPTDKEVKSSLTESWLSMMSSVLSSFKDDYEEIYHLSLNCSDRIGTSQCLCGAKSLRGVLNPDFNLVQSLRSGGLSIVLTDTSLSAQEEPVPVFIEGQQIFIERLLKPGKMRDALKAILSN